MLSPKDYLGGVPVVVRLCEKDILRPTERPAPAAFILPRTTMLVSVLPDLLHLFSPFTAALNQFTTQVWFSYQNCPIPWVYPAGAVKDYVNELVRYKRSTRLTSLPSGSPTASASSSTPAAADAANNGGGGSGVPPSSTVVLPSLTATIVSEPLELEFHICQPVKGSSVERVMPVMINFARLDEYIYNEVKQVHKATYTALYGSYKLYQNEPEQTLRAAVGMSLYRPFRAEGGAAGDLGVGAVASSSYLASSAASPSSSLLPQHRRSEEFCSPYLPAEYRHLLRELLKHRRAAYVVQVAFPLAFRAAAATGVADPGLLRFHLHRVSAGPPLQWSEAVERYAAAGTSSGDHPHHATAEEEEELMMGTFEENEDAVTLGLLVWRLFRLPCLRWMRTQQQQQSTTRTSITTTASGQNTEEDGLHILFASLAPFYADAPASALAHLEEQEPLHVLPSPAPWAAWESVMARRLTQAYESAHGDVCAGLPLLVGDRAVSDAGELNKMRLYFEVQGTQPSLATPAPFVEANLCSSDRAIFITVQGY